MARVGYGKHATQVNTSSYPDDGTSPVGSNEWNEAPSQAGILGFSPTNATLTISSGSITPTDSVHVIAGEGGNADDIDEIALTNTNEYDLLYLFGQSGYNVTLKHRGQNNTLANNEIETISGSDEVLSATKPTILMRKGNNWYGYGGGTASDLDTTNFTAATIVTESDTIASNDNDTTLPTSAAVKAYVDSTPVGDITSVVAGSGLTGGGTSADVTLNVIGGTGITANADDIAIDSTVTTLTGSQTLTNKTLTAPTLTTPALGTPASGDLQNCTAVPSAALTGTIADARMPDLTGEVTTSAGAVATIIVDDIVDEANLKVDNTPTNDYVLTAKSSASGGLTWAAGGGGDEATPVLQASGYSAANQSPSTEGTHKVSIFTKTIDSNNQGLYVRVKKNGAYEDVQIG